MQRVRTLGGPGHSFIVEVSINVLLEVVTRLGQMAAVVLGRNSTLTKSRRLILVLTKSDKFTKD